MSLPPIYDLFRKHGFRFVDAPEFITNCTKCKRENVNFAELDDDCQGFHWRCECGFSGADRLHPASSGSPAGDGNGPPRTPDDDVAWLLEHKLKNNPDGPFSAELLEKFERLKREQPRAFARLCRRYPALAAAARLDATTVRAALENASKEEVVELFIDLVLAADLNPVEIDALRRLVAEKSGIGLRPLSNLLKQRQAEQAAQRAREARAKRLAARTDSRPMVREPADTDPWLPVVSKINEVLRASTAPEPPTRDIDGHLTRARKMRLPEMHLFTTANEQDDAAGSLPPPEQWLLRRMGEIEVAELIERHIDYVNAKDESVHLKTTFVKHYVQRDDDVLPLVVAIATLPIVLGDGTLLAPDGLDRTRGIIFKVPKELRDVLPRREGCDDEAVRDAMRFLCDDWLCDVAADYTGKCIQIAHALTMIERSLLPERPTFSVTAGKSGGGKTTLFKMLIMAVTGQQAAAAAWSTDENERRKALLSYLLAGVPYILWDNIPRGAQISCPNIERSCTAGYYTDRLLGVSETVTVAASAIHSFTGNNIVPVGDLATRDLHTRLAVDRPDPENRDFRHPDPVGWTERNRTEILEKLYTILLGNPMLKQGGDAAGHTRFRAWYRLVGSAIEHAARLAGHNLDFRKLFVAHEEDAEDSSALAAALEIMARRWPGQAEFKASDIASLINREGATSDRDLDELEQMKRDSTTLRNLLLSDAPANATATAISVGKRLNDHRDDPVRHGEETLVLRAHTVHNTLHYFVTKTFDRPDPPAQAASKPAGKPKHGGDDRRDFTNDDIFARPDEIRWTSSDPLYTGPVVEVPDQGPDPLDEHGAPRATKAPPLPLTPGRARDLRAWSLDWATAQQAANLDFTTAQLEAELRIILREELPPNEVETAIKQVVDLVFMS